MSDTEDLQNSAYTDKSCSSEILEGACGRDTGLRPETPFSDNGDNLSMEVRFSEGSSHHASDLSSVSYQNLLDDDATCGDMSRRDSEDSVDSYLQDYNDDIQKAAGELGDPSYSDKISERISNQLVKDSLRLEDFNIVKSSNSVKSDPGPDAQMPSEFQLKHLKSNSVNPPINVQDSFRKHELVVDMRDQQRSKSLPPVGDNIETEKKRNSLEIRNNIPISGEAKNYEMDVHIENSVFSSHGAKPKIPKQSPGLACRVEGKPVVGPATPHTETNPLCMDSNAVQVINDLIQVSKANAAALNAANKKSQIKEEHLESSLPQNGQLGYMPPHPGDIVKGYVPPHPGDIVKGYVPQQPTDIVNEYEYVKYSRIQEGNSYVGMRLAYSSSESDSQCQKSNDGIEDLRDGTRLDLGEHDVVGGQFSPDSNLVHNNISDDMLTEIPLNGPDGLGVDDNKPFTLSPENTECDSVEIESVASEGDGEAVGMPNVEDGLSSSQASDTEEVKSEHNTPKKMLQKKQQEDVEKKLYRTECASMKPKEMDAEAIMDDLKMKREALDHAISEIKSAIQKSKGVSLEPPYNEDDEVDPIWVKR